MLQLNNTEPLAAHIMPRKERNGTDHFLKTKLTNIYASLLQTLRRDVNRLNTMSLGDKLPPGAARNLVDYIKLMREIKLDQDRLKAEIDKEVKERLESMPEEEIAKLMASRKEKKP